MKITDRSVASFRAWLAESGVTDGTIDDYVRDITQCVAAGGFIQRLTDNGLAPKTRRRTLTAARRWAEFSEDAELAKRLKPGRLRLPVANRKSVKTPLSRDQLFALVDEINHGSRIESKELVAVLGMMACRGFRCGDVLRLQRAELLEAKTTGVLAYEGKGRKRIEFRVTKNFRRYVNVLCESAGDWKRVDEIIAPNATNKWRRRAAAKQVAKALVAVGARCGIYGGLHPHKLRRTYAVEFLRAMKGDPEALVKLTQHMQWAAMSTALEYVNHDRSAELDAIAEKIFEREESEDA
jgi:site-specific recombinase XerC